MHKRGRQKWGSFPAGYAERYTKNDWVELRQNIHDLKGTSGNYGFDEMYRVSQAIEFELIKENQQGIGFEISKLDKLYDRITAGLKNI